MRLGYFMVYYLKTLSKVFDLDLFFTFDLHRSSKVLMMWTGSIGSEKKSFLPLNHEMAKSYLIASLVLFRNLPNFNRKRSGLEFAFGSSLGFCKNHFLNSILYRFYQLSLPFQNIHFSFKKISQIFSALNSV